MRLLHELLVGISIRRSIGSTSIPIELLCFDSRQALNHSCFVAIPGTQVDGHSYIAMAIAAGSKAVICEILPEPVSISNTVTYIVVTSTAKALGIMASNFYGHPSSKLKVVAVTGTNGKTTVVHLLYNMVVKMGYKAGMLSTICNKVSDQSYFASYTTPDAIQIQKLLNLMVVADCEYCFMEVSSHAIVQERLYGMYFTGAIFTNITHEHLDYHLNFLHYIQAKKKLFDSLSVNAFALVNQQDKNSSMMIQNCKAQKYTFSLQDIANFRAKVISNTLQGLELEIDNQNVWMKLLGSFNASNLLAVYGTSQLLGFNSRESLVALSAIPPILGRMNIIQQEKTPKVVIDYAHTPDAVEKVIDNLRSMLTIKNKIITVMGCGGNRDKQKRDIIGKILAVNSDLSIFTSDNPRDEDLQAIIHDMQRGVPPRDSSKVIHILDRAMAIKTACLLATPYDIILIAGKGHQHYEEVKGIKHFFCEKEIVQAIFSGEKYRV